MKSNFEECYKILNLEQKKAVDAIDGPVMVVAGPGTGKTQILTLRIANILNKTDTDPENILALTFTDSGVHAMRKRLAGMIGSMAYRVGIYTFHSFANDVIKENPEDFPTIIGAEPITEVEQIAIIEEIILSQEFKKLKPFGDSFYFVRTIVKRISDLKREGVTPENFEVIIQKAEHAFSEQDDMYHEKGKYIGKMKTKYVDEEKMIQKNKELFQIYDLYQKKLRKKKFYDFNDMIVEVLKALRSDGDLLLRLQEKHQYILVDEHQDTNNAQNKILELLADFHDNPNLFVVGDEKQSIYRFQGASLENFFYFKHLYPQAELVTLKHNYRSTQSILDSAHSLLSGESELVAHTTFENRPMSLVEFDTGRHEIVWLAEEVERLRKDDIPLHEIAVLFRNNKQAFPLVDVLKKKGIAYTLESDQNLFDDIDIRHCIQIMECVASPDENDALARILFSEVFSIDSLVSTRLVRSASQKRKKLLIDLMSDGAYLKAEDFSSADCTAIMGLANNILTWKKTAYNIGLLEMLEILVRESGLLSFIMSKHMGVQRIENLGMLFDEARSFVAGKPEASLFDFLDYIKLLKTHDLTIKKKTGIIKEHAVRLMTAHRSKGLEFDYVFILGANDGIWGNQTKRDYLPLLSGVFALFDIVSTTNSEEEVFNKDGEERRVFYVALTRARKHVTISYAKQRDDGKELLPSQFIAEIREDLIQFEDTKDFIHSWPEKQMVLFNKSLAETATLDEYKEQMKAFVQEKLTSQGLSVSALNNYLKSPWLYFFRSLVRIPSPINKHLGFGNAVHGALQDFFKASHGEKYESQDFLVGSFKHNLEKQEVTERDMQDLLVKGEEVLGRWYEEYQGSWNLDTRTEFRINGVVLPSMDFEGAPRLTGVLDKLEFQNGGHTHVTVIDYKTGKPKTEGQVKGTTKDSEGDYYRQLVFYKLLLKYFADGKMVMDKGVLEFIEPDDKGAFRRYEFEISDQEVEELEKEITRVVDEIRNLSFWDEEVNENAEEYTSLVESLKR